MRLCDDDARELVHQTEILAHLETLVESVHVAQITAGDDDVVGDLPVKLLQNLDGGGFLALQAQGVEGVRQVNGKLRGDLTDQAHAAVEIGVDGHHERAVGDGLHELRQGDLIGGEKHDGRDAGGGGVRGERG